LKRRLNKAAEATHGYKINITRTNIKWKERFTKRKKSGLFDVTYVKHQNKKVQSMTLVRYLNLMEILNHPFVFVFRK
jgi:hypothetical protein